MTTYPRFGAGLWHFASYLDRYATDGYAPAVTTLEQIARAGDALLAEDAAITHVAPAEQHVASGGELRGERFSEVQLEIYQRGGLLA